ncbi:hypothetical protein FRC12_019016 [Ceratobasidium sp. 428]|nr:hypothetical protein FRC12_019016 [Ceratobasidium sp. 428]
MPGSVCELPALTLNALNGRSGSPPSRAPPPVQLNGHYGCRSSNRLASIDMDCCPQNIHPTAYAGNGLFNPIHAGGLSVGPLPLSPVALLARLVPLPTSRVRLNPTHANLPPAPSSLLLVHPQSQGPNANQTQLPPPPSLSGAAGSSFASSDYRTGSPSPHGPPPAGSYSTCPSQNNFAPPQGYNGYPSGEAAWEREKGRDRDHDARDRESDRESRSSQQRQPGTNERVKVEVLNQQAFSDHFYPSSPVTPLPSRYDHGRGSPPPMERPPMEGNHDRDTRDHEFD